MDHPKRVHSEDLSSESDWQISDSKKKRRKKKELGVRAASPMDSGPIPPPAERPNEEDVSNPTRSSGYPGTPRFKVKTCVPEPFDFVTALSNDPRLSFRANPNRYGEYILYSRTLYTTEQLQKLDQLEKMTEKLTRAVILYYPIQLPLSAVENLPAVASVYRCTTKTKEPLRKLVAAFRGPVPARIDLGIWGSFPTATYTPEPLRCFRCQKFGHHQARCLSPNPVCGVCSGHHRTEECIAKLKAKEVLTPKCPNCSKKHHAWSPFCRARTDRVREEKAKQAPSAPAPAPGKAVTPKAVPKKTLAAFPPLSQPKPSTPAKKKQRPPKAQSEKVSVASQTSKQTAQEPRTFHGEPPRVTKMWCLAGTITKAN